MTRRVRRPIDETINNGHFGEVGKGWPYEGMYDENNGVTSSVFGQDSYRLDIGPNKTGEEVFTADQQMELYLQGKIP